MINVLECKDTMRLKPMDDMKKLPAAKKLAHMKERMGKHRTKLDPGSIECMKQSPTNALGAGFGRREAVKGKHVGKRKSPSGNQTKLPAFGGEQRSPTFKGEQRPPISKGQQRLPEHRPHSSKEEQRMPISKVQAQTILISKAHQKFLGSVGEQQSLEQRFPISKQELRLPISKGDHFCSASKSILFSTTKGEQESRESRERLSPLSPTSSGKLSIAKSRRESRAPISGITLLPSSPRASALSPSMHSEEHEEHGVKVCATPSKHSAKKSAPSSFIPSNLSRPSISTVRKSPNVKQASERSPVVTSGGLRLAMSSPQHNSNSSELLELGSPTRPPILNSPSTTKKPWSPLSLKARRGAGSPRSRHPSASFCQEESPKSPLTSSHKKSSEVSSVVRMEASVFPTNDAFASEVLVHPETSTHRSIPNLFKLASKSSPACAEERVPNGGGGGRPQVIELSSDSDSPSGKQVVIIGAKRMRSENSRPVKRRRLEGDTSLPKRPVSVGSPRKRPLSISSDEEVLLYQHSKKQQVVDLTRHAQTRKPCMIDLTGEKPAKVRKKKNKYYSDELHNMSLPLEIKNGMGGKKTLQEKKRHNSDPLSRAYSVSSDSDRTPELPMARSRFSFPAPAIPSPSSSSQPARKKFFRFPPSKNGLDRTPPLSNHAGTSQYEVITSEDECSTPEIIKEEPISLKMIKTELLSPKMVRSKNPSPNVVRMKGSSSKIVRTEGSSAMVARTEALSLRTEAALSPEMVRTEDPFPRVVREEASPNMPRMAALSPKIIRTKDPSSKVIRTEDPSPKVIRTEAKMAAFSPPPKTAATSPKMVRTEASFPPKRVTSPKAVRTEAASPTFLFPKIIKPKMDAPSPKVGKPSPKTVKTDTPSRKIVQANSPVVKTGAPLPKIVQMEVETGRGLGEQEPLQRVKDAAAEAAKQKVEAGNSGALQDDEVDSSTLKHQTCLTERCKVAAASTERCEVAATRKEMCSSDVTRQVTPGDRVQRHVLAPFDLSSMLCDSASPAGWKGTPVHEVSIVMGERGISCQVCTNKKNFVDENTQKLSLLLVMYRYWLERCVC